MNALTGYRSLSHLSSKSSFSKHGDGGDRFIPNRSAMDFDFAHYMLTAAPKKHKEEENGSKEKGAYMQILDRVLLQNRSRILAFNSRYAAPTEDVFLGSPSSQKRPVKKQRCVPQSAYRILDAPYLSDDFYLNLLDWGKRNVLAVALGHSVYLWDASVRSASEFVIFDEEHGPVTSVCWAPDGQHIAIGLDSSHVQLWDASSNLLLRKLENVHDSRVGSLAWNGSILSTGGLDGKIVNSDVRLRSHVVQTYTGHRMEVCGLKWSGSGQLLASGGNDDLVHVWDRSMVRSTSNSNRCQWLHRFDEHKSAVKALAWCPFQSNLLASGGGQSDGCIRFWNTLTGACLNSIDTGSQVCGLIWSKNERELLSSHGLPHNQLALWRYPSMVKIAELTGHSSRVLFVAQSPDGCHVASAAGDETLRFWKLSETPKVAKPATKGASTIPFASFSGITNIRN